MKKPNTNWVTIPEQSPLHTPADNPVQPDMSDVPATSRGKWFWGVSFVVLVVVTIALVMPDQFTRLIQGSLFDTSGLPSPTTDNTLGSLPVLPTDGLTPAPSAAAPSSPADSAATTTVDSDSTVVAPETDAVTIEVQPVTPAPTPVTPAPAPATADTAVPTIALTPQPVDANTQLLNDLSKQLEAVKNGAPATATPVIDLKPAAPETATPVIAAAPVITAQPTAESGYRVNAHTVALTPQMVMDQNLAQVKFNPGSAGAAPATPNASGTPASGPEDLAVVMGLAFLALLGWKGIKIAKA